jgi:hypothetical protein
MFAKLQVWLKTQFKRFILYNLLIAPIVLALYIPYNFWWLHYTTTQFWKWIFTAAVMYGAANLILAPWTSIVVRFLDRRYGRSRLNNVQQAIFAEEAKVDVLAAKIADKIDGLKAEDAKAAIRSVLSDDNEKATTEDKGTA